MRKEINPELIKALQEKNLHLPDYLCALFSIESLSEVPSYLPSTIIYHLDLAGFISKNCSNLKYELNIPLFSTESIDNKNIKWEWVKEWREMFKNAYQDRAGSLNTCIARMKTFFSENPDIRKEEVFSATMLYLESLQNVQYLTTSHKFIYEGAGKSRNSKLEEWIEKYREILERHKDTPVDTNIHISDRML